MRGKCDMVVCNVFKAFFKFFPAKLMSKAQCNNLKKDLILIGCLRL